MSSSTMSPIEKVDAWHNGTRGMNVRACSLEKLIDYWHIASFKNYTEAKNILEAELQKYNIYITSKTV